MRRRSRARGGGRSGLALGRSTRGAARRRRSERACGSFTCAGRRRVDEPRAPRRRRDAGGAPRGRHATASTAPSERARFSYTPVSVGDQHRRLRRNLRAPRRREPRCPPSSGDSAVCGAIPSASRGLASSPSGWRCSEGGIDGDFRIHSTLPQRDELGCCHRDERDVRSPHPRHGTPERETAHASRSIEQLRHADRLMTQLASGVAHEMGTPLNVVSARANARRRTATAEQVVKYGQVIVRASIVEDDRPAPRSSRGVSPRRWRHDLRRVATETIELLRPMAEKSRVRLVLQGDFLRGVRERRWRRDPAGDRESS